MDSAGSEQILVELIQDPPGSLWTQIATFHDLPGPSRNHQDLSEAAGSARTFQDMSYPIRTMHDPKEPECKNIHSKC